MDPRTSTCSNVEKQVHCDGSSLSSISIGEGMRDRRVDNNEMHRHNKTNNNFFYCAKHWICIRRYTQTCYAPTASYN
jgi:hypothetical protein